MELVPWNKGKAWNPFNELEQIHKEFDQLFVPALARHCGDNALCFEQGWSPALDVSETKDAITVKADLPGLEKNKIDVTVEDNILTIKGEKNHEREVQSKDSIRAERVYGSFRRTIALPSEVDRLKAKASYKNGVLELVLPKKEEAKRKQSRIDVD